MCTLEEYAKHVSKHSMVISIDGDPWTVNNRILRPLRPPHSMKPLRQNDIQKALRSSRAIMAVWNDNWDTTKCEWWWICCDDPEYNLEKFGKNTRRDIRAGLRRCTVRRLETDYFAKNGYPVYQAAFAHYDSEIPLISESVFAKNVYQSASYPGRETWGAIANGVLIAWASCIIVDDVVHLSWAKSDPAHFNLCPNNALCYELTRHYLRERNMRYVTDGCRNLHHDTNFPDFLCKMGFRRMYCPVRIALHPLVLLVLKSGIARWGRFGGLGRVAPKQLHQLDALAKLYNIAKQCLSCDSDIRTLS